MIQLESIGTQHILVSVNDGLGNCLSFEEFQMNPAYTNQFSTINPKLETIRDFTSQEIRQRTNKLGYLKSDSVSKTTLYAKDSSTGTRVHFGITKFKNKDIMIISDVYLKNSGDQSDALKKSTEILETAINWVKENEEKFQKIIEDIS